MNYLQYYMKKLVKVLAVVLVLNLIINGLPSIRKLWEYLLECHLKVLNLIINGLPSILLFHILYLDIYISCFKPYYKWITFNTKK